jgi:hypothetical protein
MAAEADPKRMIMNDKTKTPDGQKNKPLADYEADARAVRANMEKLRALRLAKEAAEAAAAPAKTTAGKAARKTGAKKAGDDKKAAPAKLSDWLADQQKGGFRT